MEEVSVGVVTAPGMPKKLLEDIMESLRDEAGASTDDEITWQIEYETDVLASSAEFVSEIFGKMESIKEKNDWDMAIAISDLPSVSNKKIVLAEIDHEESTSLISFPALGFYRNGKKLRTLLLHHMDVMYYKKETDRGERVQPSFFNRISRVTSEEDSDRQRYILKSTTAGWLRIISGMTFLNEPWTDLWNFKTITALAFATGTYISIYRTPWELSLDYSMWRLILLMVIAVFGMVGWLIYTHNLWEKRTTKNQPTYRRLYNFTTLLTLLWMTLVIYVAVSVLLIVSILVFVPMGLFETWTEVDRDVKWPDYLNLIWFNASLGILAGAFGSTVEDEEKVRSVTYSYRQMYRHRQLEQEAQEEEEVSEAEKDEEYVGEEQTHDESEEGK